MAAAALSSSRGVAGGLYILFTLLCLVCLASSWTYDEKLKNLKEDIQKAEQHLKNLKMSQSAQKATFSETMSKSVTFNEVMIAFAEKVSEKSPYDSLALKEILERARRLMEEVKTYIDQQNELTDAKIADIELNLGGLKTFVRELEEYHAEL